jgi:hypothetical protein
MVDTLRRTEVRSTDEARAILLGVQARRQQADAWAELHAPRTPSTRERGVYLKTLRSHLGLSQRDVAQAMGIPGSRGAIADAERNARGSGFCERVIAWLEAEQTRRGGPERAQRPYGHYGHTRFSNFRYRTPGTQSTPGTESTPST